VVTAISTAVAVHNLAHFGALHNAPRSKYQLIVLKGILINGIAQKNADSRSASKVD
jgi:hypothetical protein